MRYNSFFWTNAKLMYPFLRLGKTLLRSSVAALQGKGLLLTDTSEIELTTNVNDIDNFFEMNNGRIFTLFDLGRTDFAVRVGLGKKLLTQGWGLVVAGSTIQYRKRIRLLTKVRICTRLVAIDDRWFYIEQSMQAKGQTACTALIRAGVTDLKNGRTLKSADVLQALGCPDLAMPPTGWVKAWIDADKQHPLNPQKNADA